MEEVRSVYWEAPEHHHSEKTSDWYWILGIIGISGSTASIIFGNVLFGVVILLGMMTLFITGNRKPRMVQFEISPRGVRVDDELHPFATLASFGIDEEGPQAPQMIVKSKKLFAPLLIIPIPEEYIDDIEDLLSPRLREEHLEEPISHRIFELLGF